jgi:glycolate oxidase FAD binding subunit
MDSQLTPRPLSHAVSDIPIIQPQTVAEMADAIRELATSGKSIAVQGSGTKWGMGAARAEHTDKLIMLKTGQLRGVSEYDPGELTITAGAGTLLSEVTELLAKNGQYLPFDPLYSDSLPSATLGGTVGAGLSGPRRLRYGGLRDFVIGIHYLDSAGTLIKAGGKVVKNAAGYDYPKLFCGSLGTLGVITQVSFKVFPRPETSQTLLAVLPSISALQSAFQQVTRSKAEISAADAWRSVPADAISASPQPALTGDWTLAVQIDGLRDSISARLDMIQKLLPAATPTSRVNGEPEMQLWETLRDVRWIDTPHTVLRFYLVSDQVMALDRLLDQFAVQRVYSLAGNAAWGVMSGDPSVLSDGLAALGIKASVWRTMQTNTPEILPVLPAFGLVTRLKKAFDPNDLFYPGRYAT